MRATCLAALGAVALLAGCGPTAEQQAAMDAAQRARDQDRCAGFGFAPATDAFARCMMNLSGQRDADAAADRRAAADRAAADQRTRDADRAAKDRADRDAWDRKTGQGAYSSTPPSSNPFSASSDPIADAIERDRRKLEGE